MVEPDGWIEILACDPREISWSKIKQGLAVMGIRDPDDIVEFRLAEGNVTISRVRRATRVAPSGRRRAHGASYHPAPPLYAMVAERLAGFIATLAAPPTR